MFQFFHVQPVAPTRNFKRSSESSEVIRLYELTFLSSSPSLFSNVCTPKQFRNARPIALAVQSTFVQLSLPQTWLESARRHITQYPRPGMQSAVCISAPGWSNHRIQRPVTIHPSIHTVRCFLVSSGHCSMTRESFNPRL